MCIAIVIAWACIGIAVAAILLFLWILVRKILATRAVGLGEAAETRAAEAVGEAVTGFAKLLDAFAKVIEALTKAPEAVVAAAVAMFFMVLAIIAALLPCRHQDKPSVTGTYGLKTSAVPCVVFGFPSGEHTIASPGDPQALKDFTEDPPRCVENMVSQAQSQEIAFLLLVGHADTRELNPQQRAIYHSNITLAYQRALALEEHILASYKRLPSMPAPAGQLSSEQLTSRIIVLSAGPSNLGAHVPSPLLERDRSVELLPYWITLIRPGDSVK